MAGVWGYLDNLVVLHEVAGTFVICTRSVSTFGLPSRKDAMRTLKKYLSSSNILSGALGAQFTSHSSTRVGLNIGSLKI